VTHDLHTPLEERLFLWVNADHGAAVDAAARLLSAVAFGIACFAAAALVVAWGRRWRALGALSLAVAASDFLGDRLLRPAFGRMRPCYALPRGWVHWIADGADVGSIPSLHAANFFAMAFVVAAARPRLAPIAYLTAAAVAWSRIQVGVHWPTDVLVGALWGTVCGAAAWLAARARARAAPRPGAPGGSLPRPPPGAG
jgi:undecaprenyl-diphosphatase